MSQNDQRDNLQWIQKIYKASQEIAAVLTSENPITNKLSFEAHLPIGSIAIQ